MLWWFSTLCNFTSMHTQLILPIYSVKLQINWGKGEGRIAERRERERVIVMEEI